MLKDKLKNGDFVITCEILTPLDSNFDKISEDLSQLDCLIDGFNIPFCPLGRLRPHSLLTGLYVRENYKAEPILHLSARHHTILSFEATLLLCQAIGIRNILLITGDPPQEGEANYRLDSISLLRLASGLNQGLSYSRRQIPNTTRFLLAAAFNPNRSNLRGEILRLKKKYEAGAEVIFTQPVFDGDRFRSLIDQIRTEIPDIKVISGISFLYNKKTAFRLRKFLGIPYQYIDRLDNQDETDLLFDVAVKIKGSVDGFYIIPIGRYQNAIGLIRRIKENLA